MGFFFFFNFFLLFFGFDFSWREWGKGVTQKGGKEENHNPWFRFSSAGKDIFLVSPHAKKEKKQTHLELCTDYVNRVQDQPWRSAFPAWTHPLVRLLVEPTSQKSSFSKASSFLLVGYKNRTSVVNRRVLNTFNH